MNQTRFDSIMANQTGYAKKVYAAIPKLDAWNAAQICAELSRLGHTINYRTVEGCVKTLAEAGLVIAIPPDRYRSVAVKTKALVAKSLKEVPALMKQDTAPGPVPAPVPPTVVAIPAVDRLVHMADALNTTGKMLITMAEDLTDIADSITRTTEADQANLQRLRQLQDLLRGIGMTASA